MPDVLRVLVMVSRTTVYISCYGGVQYGPQIIFKGQFDEITQTYFLLRSSGAIHAYSSVLFTRASRHPALPPLSYKGGEQM